MSHRGAKAGRQWPVWDFTRRSLWLKTTSHQEGSRLVVGEDERATDFHVEIVLIIQMRKWRHKVHFPRVTEMVSDGAEIQMQAV